MRKIGASARVFSISDWKSRGGGDGRGMLWVRKNCQFQFKDIVMIFLVDQ
jgi:hypothetical protein